MKHKRNLDLLITVSSSGSCEFHNDHLSFESRSESPPLKNRAPPFDDFQEDNDKMSFMSSVYFDCKFHVFSLEWEKYHNIDKKSILFLMNSA